MFKVFRKTKFFVVLYVALCLFVIGIMSYMFLSYGLDVEAEYVVDNGKGYVELNLKNESNHIINDISIYNNSVEVWSIEKIGSGETLVERYEVSTELNNLEVKADNHLSFSKTLNVSLPEINIESGFTYNLSVEPFFVNFPNEVYLDVCNKSESTSLNIEIEENSLFESDDLHKEGIIPEDECNKFKFVLIPIKEGEAELVFNVYNDYYSRTLRKDIEVSVR